MGSRFTLIVNDLSLPASENLMDLGSTDDRIVESLMTFKLSQEFVRLLHFLITWWSVSGEEGFLKFVTEE